MSFDENASLLDRLRDGDDLRSRIEAADEIEELRAVLRGIVDLGGTMGSALYAETVDRAARAALAKAEAAGGFNR